MLSHQQIIEKVSEWMSQNWPVTNLRMNGDTSDFFKIGYGDIVLLDSHA